MMDRAERILNFLVECGGAYTKITPEMEFSVYFCLGAKQYVLEESNGQIKSFACYWKVQPDDVFKVAHRIKPDDLTGGSVMYVAEMASRSGLSSIIRALRQIKGIQGAFWHRPAKKDKVYIFPSQHSAR